MASERENTYLFLKSVLGVNAVALPQTGQPLQEGAPLWHTRGPETASLVFIHVGTALLPTEYEMLERMIRAIKLLPADVMIIEVPIELDEYNKASVRALLEAQPNREIVALGEETVAGLLDLWPAFARVKPNPNIVIGAAVQIESLRVVVTHSLAVMAKSPALKKETWSALQTLKNLKS